MEVDLDTQLVAVHLDTQHAAHLVVAMPHRQLIVLLGLIGALALLHLKAEQEHALLVIHAQHQKLGHA